MAKSKTKNRSFFLVLFGLPFFGAGVGMLWFLTADPVNNGLASKNWPKVACEVIHSKLDSSSDGDTYRVDIQTSYSYQGRDYDSGSYDASIDNFYSSGASSKRKVVNQYPVGWKGDCYVNPNDPALAVLKRGVPGVTWILIPFGSVFAIVGLLIMASGLGAFSKKPRRPSELTYNEGDSASAVLKPSVGPKSAVAVAGFIALFWNGIVSVFLITTFLEWRDGGRVAWFMLLFMIPFVAVGIYLLKALFTAILAAFNPEPILTLDKQSPRLGDSVALEWGLLGKRERIQNMTMILEGREKATYRVGTNTRTDTHVIHSEQLVATDLNGVNDLNAVDFMIPADAMHSFEADNNEIEWVIKVDGVIDKWPDIEYEYPFWVRP